MKWSEYESKNPKEKYTKAMELCEEHHTNVNKKKGFSARFCNHCYERDGWKCFPCNDVKKVYEERYGERLDGKAKNK